MSSLCVFSSPVYLRSSVGCCCVSSVLVGDAPGACMTDAIVTHTHTHMRTCPFVDSACLRFTLSFYAPAGVWMARHTEQYYFCTAAGHDVCPKRSRVGAAACRQASTRSPQCFPEGETSQEADKFIFPTTDLADKHKDMVPKYRNIFLV